MSEQQSTTNNTETPSKPDYMTRLANKAERLEKELKETRATLKAKRAQKAALENAAYKKARTRLLILGGIALAKSLQIAATAGKDQAAYWQGVFAKAQENQAPKSESQKTKYAEDRQLFTRFIELAKAGQL